MNARWLQRLWPIASLLALCLLIPAAEWLWLGQESRFLTPANLAAIIRQTAAITIMAVGMTMVMVAGGVDLSVGSTVGVAAVSGALVMAQGSVTAGVAVALIAGALCGWLNGLIITWLRIPPFIVTLGTMGIYRGVALLLSGGTAISGLPAGAGWLAEAHVAGLLPVPLLLVAGAALVMHGLLTHTTLGRHSYASGSSAEAARYAGVNVDRIRHIGYTLLGLLCGLAGALDVARTVTGQPNAGETYELNVIAAVVIGGGSLTGGQGTVAGTLIGALIMGVLANGGNLLQVSPFIQKIVIGMVIILAVTADTLRRRREGQP
jgi:ribose/xylose/arabinose/galactoside ABC-type transport system permease subunit